MRHNIFCLAILLICGDTERTAEVLAEDYMHGEAYISVQQK